MDTPKRPKRGLPHPGPSSMNLAAFKPEKRTVDINQCIMCQWNESLSKQNIDEPLITTKNGREKIVSAADNRKDGTHSRLALLSPNPDERSSVIFVYHMNNSCYRTYCHSGKLRKLEDKLPKQEVTEPESISVMNRPDPTLTIFDA